MRTTRLGLLAAAALLATAAGARGPEGHLEIGYDRSTGIANSDADGVHAAARLIGPQPYPFFGMLQFANLQLDPGPGDFQRSSVDLGYRIKVASSLHLPLSFGYDRFQFTTSDVDARSFRLGIEAQFDRKGDLSLYFGHAFSADDNFGLDYDVNEFGGAASVYFTRQLGLFARYRLVRFNPDGAAADFETREAMAGLKVVF